MVNKKILSIIIGIAIIGAGTDAYFVLSDQGYINPGIQISSISESSNTMMNDSFDFPFFTAHVNSSKTAEYEVLSNNHILFTGPVTGEQNILFPNSIIELDELCYALSAAGLHKIIFRVAYNTFSTSKSITVYTFPHISFSALHTHIDTGISDTITASSDIDNLTLSAMGITQPGQTITLNPSTSGNYTVNYSVSNGPFHNTGKAAIIHVYNPPRAIGISVSNLSCNPSNFYGPCTTFNVTMTSSGGDIFDGLTYEAYVNNSYYSSICYSSSHSYSLHITEYGSGPFSIYFMVKDRYYVSTSKTIDVN